MNPSALRRKQGFTLVELLVVISIIAILSVIGITIFSSVQKSARNAKRIADLKAIALALDQYYNDPANNFQYPNPSPSLGWRSECLHWQNLASDQVIPGLVPKYLAKFPSDPSMDKNGDTSCYIYRSNGTDYTLLDHRVSELSGRDYLSYKQFVDPARDGGPNGCVLDYDTTNPGIYSWKISSTGGRCW